MVNEIGHERRLRRIWTEIVWLLKVLDVVLMINCLIEKKETVCGRLCQSAQSGKCFFTI